MKNIETLTKKHYFDVPIYFDNAKYVHDHFNFDEKQRKYYASIKKHLGRNHNQSEMRVLVNGVYQSI